MGTTEADAKRLIRAFTDRLNAGDYEGVRELFADDYAARHDNDHEHVESVDELLDNELARAEAFAGKHEGLTDVLTDTDYDGDGVKLEAWYEVTGTHSGEFLNVPPSGNDVTFHLVRPFIVADGEVTRYRVVYTLGFLLDIGVHWEALTDEVDVGRYVETPAVAGSAKTD